MATASSTVARILEQSGLSKSALAARSGVSRSMIDNYLKGTTQPSLAQTARLAEAAGLELEVTVRRRRRVVPEQFLAVLEFGDLFPRKPPRELPNLGPLWRDIARRTAPARLADA
ncbi:helix-turn-helix domain-containing protein [Nocardioides sp. BYT-33-1]|jgi:transcriptional regulator with XRE-family HTH domain|uniref:helix-turn-helix domain-containing protein n=1 Tax=Nocardioides sp. BYT-33-1 TaxID=3416952 RepID=UPI003F53AA8D